MYAKPERQQDLARLQGLLSPLVAGQRVLEIAAGTGYWTRVLSGSAAAITATDLNAETLELARAREYGGAAVTFRLADAYALDQVPGEFDTAFVGFFWSHVLRGDLPRFVAGLSARMGPGARLIVLDNSCVPAQQPSDQPHHRGGRHLPAPDPERRAQLRDPEELPGPRPVHRRRRRRRRGRAVDAAPLLLAGRLRAALTVRSPASSARARWCASGRCTRASSAAALPPAPSHAGRRARGPNRSARSRRSGRTGSAAR